MQQANGDIYNYGLAYNDVKEICRDVVRQEFQIVTKDAIDKLTIRKEQRLKKYYFATLLNN